MAELVHGTVIALGPYAVLIRGRSGSGKSDLALRCLALPPSSLIPTAAMLVADDQVLLSNDEGRAIATCPPTTCGRMEVRGLGIVVVPYQPAAELLLIADLSGSEPIERYPDPVPTASLLGVPLPVIRLAALEASSSVKLLISLSHFIENRKST